MNKTEVINNMNFLYTICAGDLPVDSHGCTITDECYDDWKVAKYRTKQAAIDTIELFREANKDKCVELDYEVSLWPDFVEINGKEIGIGGYMCSIFKTDEDKMKLLNLLIDEELIDESEF